MTATSRSAALFSAAALLVIGAAVVTHLAARPGPADLYHSLADESLIHPLALKAACPHLYARDVWLADAEGIFSRLYSRLLGPFLDAADHPGRVAWALSALPRGLFLLGAFLLALRWTRSRWSGLALVALLLLPGAATWSIAPGQVLPRDLVFALLPFALLALPDGGRRAPLVAAGIALGLGLASNLHPLTGLHLFMLAGPAAVLFAPGRRLLTAVLQPPAFALGALPCVLDFLAAPRAGSSSAEALLVRVPDLVSVSASSLLATFGPLALLLAVPLFLRLPGLTAARRALLLVGLAAIFALPGGLLTAKVPALTQFQLLRLTRILGFLVLIPAAALLGSLAGHRGWRLSRAGAGAILLLLVLSTGVQREWFERAGRRFFGRPAPFAPPAPPRPRGGELAGRPEGDRAAYLAFAGRCRGETPTDALILVPPEDFSHFRLYARRSIVVDRKVGGFAVTLLGGKGLDWLAQYRQVVGLYARKDREALLAYCREKGVDFVVAELPEDDFALPVVFREGPFVLHAVAPR